ncbi:rare lipoprotein A [Nitratiruptor sp. YY09-18]|nr:rare lipoprotein A [Nitratiruptor sp. YY09-18]
MWSCNKIALYLVIASLFWGCSSRQEAPFTPPSGTPNYGEAKSSPSIHRATMRPYTVNGVVYHPTVVAVGSKQRGIASWYGPNFHGKKTSNGEIYDMYKHTAAHKTLPMNTMVKVTNLRNGKSTIVRINDRGPFVANRIIDLSYSAAKELGVVGAGTAPVELEVLGFDKHIKQKETVATTPSTQSVVLSDFAVQIGSFRRYQGAQITKRRNAVVDNRYRAVIKKFIVDGEPLYRVWLTGFRSEDEARDFIVQGRYPGAFIVRN